MNLEVTSYLKNYSKNQFLTIYEVKDSKEFIEDPFYIEGGILITYKNEVFLGYEDWDLLDQLWSYFIAAIYNLVCENSQREVFIFPDQALQVEIKKVENQFVLNIYTRSICIEKKEFISSFITEGKKCLEQINYLLKTNDFEEELRKIEVITQAKQQK